MAEQLAAAQAASNKKSVTIKEPQDEDGFVQVGKGGKSAAAKAAVSVDVFEKLAQVMDARGKKVTFVSNITPTLFSI